MTVYLTPRDLQQVVCDLLRATVVAAYPAAHVGAKMPVPRPSHAVTVRRDGGAMIDQVQVQGQVGINVWAPTTDVAYAMAALVEKTLLQSVDGATVFGAESISGPAEIAEEAEVGHIYMTFEVVVRGL